jgi:hypothetical protein
MSNESSSVGRNTNCGCCGTSRRSAGTSLQHAPNPASADVRPKESVSSLRAPPMAVLTVIRRTTVPASGCSRERSAAGRGHESWVPGCDVVTKGSITSWVIDPRAIADSAKTYRRRDWGGASAGAIGAAFGAAAELGREQGGLANSTACRANSPRARSGPCFSRRGRRSGCSESSSRVAPNAGGGTAASGGYRRCERTEVLTKGPTRG